MNRELINRWFSYQSPKPDQIERYGELRGEFRALAHTIDVHCPDGATKMEALRMLRATNMMANASIACDEE